jgi:hypothetical protein
MGRLVEYLAAAVEFLIATLRAVDRTLSRFIFTTSEI